MLGKRILLLSCCAPCSIAVIEKLKLDGENFAVIFFNPNIHPSGEYKKRLEEQRILCNKLDIEFIELEYDPKGWFEAVKGFEDEEERGKRCSICFYYRLKRVMTYAKENGFDGVSSVLGVSRWKNLKQVNEAGHNAENDTGVPYIEIEGRKGGLQERRNFLIKEFGLYNQEYCGCVFSQRIK